MAAGMIGPEGLVGQSIAGYRLDKLLGVGATGAVFLGTRLPETTGIVERTGALPTELPQQTAIKVLILPWQLTADEREDFRKRFIREAQTLQRLRHPHIVPVLTFGEDSATGLMYMILPYMSGGTLASTLANAKGGLPFAVVSNYLTQIAAALDYAHSQGVIHRDIKPANVLLDGAGQPYLADFSIVRLVADTHTKLTTTGRIMGTPRYMAPEQISGAGPLGPAGDIYSLGMVVYEMLTGRVAFDAGSLMEMIQRHVQVAPPPPHQLRPDLPPPAEAAVLRALAKQPQDRFTSAGMFAYAFAAGLQGRWLEAPRTPTSGNEVTVSEAAPTPSGTPYEGSGYPNPGYAGAKKPPVAQIGLAALALLLIGLLLVTNASRIGATLFGARGTPTLQGNVPTATTAPASASPTANSGGPNALVPAGGLIYQTSAPGACDNHGGAWGQNPYAVQSCANGGLILAGPNGNLPLGVVVLASMPGQPYPQNYVVEVQATLVGSDPTAYFGFKFRQQSIGDTGQGRGGYSFLYSQNGHWEYNEYSASGAYNPSPQTLPFAVNATNTLDLVVSGSSFSFYINGQLVSQQDDATYGQGYLCLVAEPGAQVLFQNLAIYALPS